MRRPATAFGVAMISLLAGCAHEPAPEKTSHITGAQFRDTSALTVFIADILANSLTPSNTTLRLAPFSGPDPARAQILLRDTLRERGFALSPDGMPYPGAHTVRYAVSPVGLNLLLELDVDDASATCLYGHEADGALRRAGSCTLRAGAGLTLRIPARDVLSPGAAPSVSVPSTGQATPLPSTPSSGPQGTAVPDQPTPSRPPASSPPVQPPAEVWTLVEGQPIREQMIAWADRAGWKIRWPHTLNWNVPALTSFTGDFHTVMSTVVRTIADEGKSIRAEFHPSNRYLVVTSPGGEDR